MILPGVNLLVHAYNSESPSHAKARAWWEDLSNGTADRAGLGRDARLQEHQGELHSTDADFRRFAGLRWRNPLD